LKNGKAIALSRLFSGLAILAGLVGIVSFLFYWDVSRKAIKRMQASSPYKFEEVDPRHLKVDPASLIHLQSKEDAERVRAALATVVWGDRGAPVSKMPSLIVPDLREIRPDRRCPNRAIEDYTTRTIGCSLGRYYQADNLAEVGRLTINVSPTYQPKVSHFKPVDKNGVLILYHHGYAGTHQDQWRHILRWVEFGYGVMAFDYTGYGNAAPGVDYGKAGYLRSIAEPIAVALNYALDKGDYEEAHMVGLSAGGWVTALYAALDPRVSKSYPVSGVYPVYLRSERETAAPQLNDAMLKAASYLDMFALASVGVGRGQMQVFNRFDRCCFNGLRSQLYKDQVSKAVSLVGSGSFSVLLDETHARHKISRWAFEAILEDMGEP